MDLAALEPLDFTCPRCSAATTAPIYGPCERCRQELRATLGSDPETVDTAFAATAFEPKMNVTPNAVALKD